jgi:predicted FMN-binding regulatory protein PaiB
MQHYPIYQTQSPEMMQRFLEQRPYCLLITQNSSGPPQSGLFNPLVEDSSLYLHLHRQDPQLRMLEAEPRATLVFTDYHGYVPSYAKHPEDASFATMFYRFVEVRARLQSIASPSEAAAILDRMMLRYQPEGGYRPVAENPSFYEKSLQMIAVLQFNIESTNCKWKLGQNRTAHEQLAAHSFIHR